MWADRNQCGLSWRRSRRDFIFYALKTVVDLCFFFCFYVRVLRACRETIKVRPVEKKAVLFISWFTRQRDSTTKCLAKPLLLLLLLLLLLEDIELSEILPAKNHSLSLGIRKGFKATQTQRTVMKKGKIKLKSFKALAQEESLSSSTSTSSSLPSASTSTSTTTTTNSRKKKISFSLL